MASPTSNPTGGLTAAHFILLSILCCLRLYNVERRASPGIMTANEGQRERGDREMAPATSPIAFDRLHMEKAAY